MPLSLGEVIGALEREARRTRELYEAVLELSSLNDQAGVQRNTLAALTRDVESAKAELQTVLQTTAKRKAEAVAIEQAAQVKWNAAVAEVTAQHATLRDDLKRQTETIRQQLDGELQAARAATAAAKQEAADAERKAATARAAIQADLDAVIAQRDRIKAEIAALRQRVMAN